MAEKKKKETYDGIPLEQFDDLGYLEKNKPIKKKRDKNFYGHTKCQVLF